MKYFLVFQVCSKFSDADSESLNQLVTTLVSILEHGGGSLVEIYKYNESPGPRDNLNMLSALRVIDRVATI